MIQTLPCPGCNRSLVLIGDVSMEAILRCGHCGDRFVLGEMIKSRLGCWEVISDPDATAILRTSAANMAEAETETASQPVVLSGETSPVKPHDLHATWAGDGADGTPDSMYASEDHQNDIELEPEGIRVEPVVKSAAVERKAVDWSKLEPLVPARNDRRRHKSSMLALLPVVLGGLASLPVALLLIWYVLGTDPLKLAPAVSRYFPWIVPTQLRPYDEAEREPLTLVPKTGDSVFRRFDDLTGSGSLPVSASDLKPRTEEPGKSVVKAASAEISTPNSSQHSVASSHTAVGQGGSNDAKLSATLLRLIGSQQAWQKGKNDRAERSKVAKELYAELTKMAVLASGPSSSQLQSAEARAVCRELMIQEDLRDLVNQGARYWFENRKQNEVALAMCLQVSSVKDAKGPQVLAMSATGGKKLLVHLRLGGDQAVPKLGQHMFVLGTAKALTPGQPQTDVKEPMLEIEVQAHFSLIEDLDP